MTMNYGDFEDLHNLVVVSRGHHCGVMVVRLENDPTWDMSPRAIARAVQNLAVASEPLQDCFHVLNHWI